MLGEWTEWNVSVIEQEGNRLRRREAGRVGVESALEGEEGGSV